jgi:hypothetical protein
MRWSQPLTEKTRGILQIVGVCYVVPYINNVVVKSDFLYVNSKIEVSLPGQLSIMLCIKL